MAAERKRARNIGACLPRTLKNRSLFSELPRRISRASRAAPLLNSFLYPLACRAKRLQHSLALQAGERQARGMLDLEQLKAAVESKIDEAKTLRDELRLKAHLGGMEGKERLEQLEQEFAQLETQLRAQGQTLSENLSTLTHEARDLFHKMREKIG